MIHYERGKWVEVSTQVTRATSLPELHTNELYVRHYKQVWCVTWGPTISQSLGFRQGHIRLIKKCFILCKRWDMTLNWYHKCMPLYDRNGFWNISILKSQHKYIYFEYYEFWIHFDKLIYWVGGYTNLFTWSTYTCPSV